MVLKLVCFELHGWAWLNSNEHFLISKIDLWLPICECLVIIWTLIWLACFSLFLSHCKNPFFCVWSGLITGSFCSSKLRTQQTDPVIYYPRLDELVTLYRIERQKELDAQTPVRLKLYGTFLKRNTRAPRVSGMRSLTYWQVLL